MSGASPQQGYPDDFAQMMHQDTLHLFGKWRDGKTIVQDISLLFKKWQDAKYAQDNGQFSGRSTGSGGASNQHASELQSLHRTVNQLEERCLLLENIAHESELLLEGLTQVEQMLIAKACAIMRVYRLKGGQRGFSVHVVNKQAADRNRLEREMKQNEDKFDEKIKEKDARMGDMALHIRTRDRQVMALEEKVRRSQRDLQTYHKKKHEIVEKALKLERESVRDRERAALDIRHMSSSGSYSGAATAATGEPRGDLGRRTPSSSSFFGRGTAGGPGAGAANGAAGGGRGAGTPGVPIDQIRKLCVQNNLSEFFMYDPGASRS